MSRTFRLVLSQAALALALVVIAATPSRAQSLGKMTGAPYWPSPRPVQESVVAESEINRVEELLSGIAIAVQELSLSARSLSTDHEAMINGISDALRQLQLVHDHLRTVLTDPTVLQHKKAALSFSRVHRQLEATAVALRKTAESTRRALREATTTSH
jgi:hypothetical protein